MVDDCIFCKIAAGEIPCVKIWEDEKFMAFLDITPAAKGQTLVIPKEHISSNIYQAEDSKISEAMSAAKKVSKVLESGLEAERVITVIEGLEVDHLHIKLYPYSKEKYEGYRGYISTEGEEKSVAELELIKKEILGESD